MKQIVQPQIQHHTSTASSTSSNLPSVSPQCYPLRLSDSGGDDRRNSLICKNLIINLMFISSWYLFATLISLYNKWMFSPEHYDFQYPLFVSSCHMVVQFVLAAITLASFGSIRPTIRPNLKDYSKKAVPCGIASGLDIGLSNTSLKTVTLSFYTMCKSSSLAFVLFFAFLFKLEKPTYKLTGIILLITAGVILMVSSETKFEFLGMVQVLSASCMGGLRWSLTQILLDKRSMGMNTPIATIFWLAPTMAISLGLCSLIFEGWSKLVAEERFFGDLLKGLVTMGYVTAAGVMAFLMTVSEYFLIQRTSVVTLSIAGIFKEVGTILLSTMIFHDVMTPLNISGLGITIFGIGLYNYLKYKQSLESLKESEAILLNDESDNRSKTNRSTTSPDYEIVSNEIALEERKTFSKRLQSSNIKNNKNISSNEYFDDDERIRGVGSKGYERGGQIVVEIDSDQEMSLKRTESRRYDASEDEGEDLSNDDGDGVGSNDQETKKLIGRVKTSGSLIYDRRKGTNVVGTSSSSLSSSSSRIKPSDPITSGIGKRSIDGSSNSYDLVESRKSQILEQDQFVLGDEDDEDDHLLVNNNNNNNGGVGVVGGKSKVGFRSSSRNSNTGNGACEEENTMDLSWQQEDGETEDGVFF